MSRKHNNVKAAVCNIMKFCAQTATVSMSCQRGLNMFVCTCASCWHLFMSIVKSYTQQEVGAKRPFEDIDC